MQIIIDYFNNPDNKLYIMVLCVTLVLLILLSGLIVFAYKRKKQNTEPVPTIPEKAMPEDIVEVLDNMSIDAPNDQSNDETEENSDTLDDKTLNKPGKIDIPGASHKTIDMISVPTGNTESAQSAEKTNKGTETSTNAGVNDDKSQVKLTGKWVIVTAPDGKLSARLETSEGETILTTENYTSLSGLKSGIETLKNNILKDNYAINIDKNGLFVFKVFTGDRILCESRGYTERKPCENAFAKAKHITEHASIENNKMPE